MFTGIVEQIGTVASVEDTEDGRRMIITTPGLGDLPLGASMAVNGVCLTVVEPGEDRVALDVVPETLRRTNLGSLAATSSVNLERPMRADGRYDGHIVQGHVDGTGIIESITDDQDGAIVEISVDQALMRYVVEKGSITVDGVSLTVAEVADSTFAVALIPHTLEVTTLGLRKVGDTVNLEVDVLAKYVERMIKAHT